jgi:zinc protease
VTVRRPGTLNLVMAGYIRPGALHADFIALEVLQSILSEGVNSRLHQALVEKGLATNVSANNFTLRDPFPLLLSATVSPGRSPQEVEDVIKAVVAEVAAHGVTEGEVRRAQQQIEVGVVRSRDGTYNFAQALGEAVASADWKWFLAYVDRIKRVTAAEVQRVAAAHLTPEHATVGWFVPAAGAPPKAAAVIAPPVANTEAPPAAEQPARVAGAPAKASFAQRTVRKVLANGIIVDVMENRAVPTVAMRGMVFAGDATAPPSKPALPALAARMLARGTTTRTKEQIGALLDDVGATRSYAAGLTEMTIQANGMARELPLMLEVIAEELARPAFAAEEIAKAKRELENDYLRNDDNTSLRAMLRLGQLVYPRGHPYYGFSRAEKTASLQALTEADLREFHRARFSGAGIVLAIVGDVDAQQTLALVEKHLGGLPRGERISFGGVARVSAPPQGTREAVTLRGKANMNIVMGTASGLRRLDPDYEAALIANAALGQTALSSRIGRRVRDTEGLTYQIFSRFGFSEELDGLWFVNVNVAPQNLARAMRSTREELDKYAREGASAAEIEAQKSFFAGNFQVGLGSNAGIAAALVAAEKYGFGPRYLDEYPQRIKAVTAQQANAAMKKYFFADRLNVIVAGDLETLPD